MYRPKLTKALLLRFPHGSTVRPKRGDQLSLKVYFALTPFTCCCSQRRPALMVTYLLNDQFLHEARIEVRGRLEVQVSELATGLTQIDTDPTVGADVGSSFPVG